MGAPPVSSPEQGPSDPKDRAENSPATLAIRATSAEQGGRERQGSLLSVGAKCAAGRGCGSVPPVPTLSGVSSARTAVGICSHRAGPAELSWAGPLLTDGRASALWGETQCHPPSMWGLGTGWGCAEGGRVGGMPNRLLNRPTALPSPGAAGPPALGPLLCPAPGDRPAGLPSACAAVETSAARDGNTARQAQPRQALSSTGGDSNGEQACSPWRLGGA